MWQVHDQTPALVAVVFGKVVEGMAVVKRIEAAGSKSGRTAQRVVIASCGELASRRKIMAQLEAEKVSLSFATCTARAACRCTHADAQTGPVDGFLRSQCQCRKGRWLVRFPLAELLWLASLSAPKYEAVASGAPLQTAVLCRRLWRS